MTTPKAPPSDVKLMARQVRVVTKYRVPLLGSSSKDGSIVYIDSVFFRETNGGFLNAQTKGGEQRRYNVMRGLQTHEKVEWTLESLGWSYTYSHREYATRLENKVYEDDGMDASSVQRAFNPWIARLAREKIPKSEIAPDMYELPAEHPHNREQKQILSEDNATENKPEPK